MERIRYFKNNVPSDIYIGRSAGKKLLEDIVDAKYSVKIISPFLSPAYTEVLIKLKKRGRDIQLITSDEIEDYNKIGTDKIIYELIKQKKHSDEAAIIRRNRLRKLNKWLTIFWIAIFFIIITISFYTNNPKILLNIGIVFILSMISLVIRNTIKNKRIYTYSYETFFPFKVFISPLNRQLKYKSSYYIHSKIFIIDNRIAYLGSINFSKSGMEYNFESRIRITDSDTISGLNKTFDELFNSQENFFWDIAAWGKNLYREPIN